MEVRKREELAQRPILSVYLHLLWSILSAIECKSNQRKRGEEREGSELESSFWKKCWSSETCCSPEIKAGVSRSG